MATIPSRNNIVNYWQSNRERVEGLNRRAGEAIKAKFSRIPLLEEQVCVSAIGSDGRLEKGLDSKLEVQLLHRGLSQSSIMELGMMLREIEFNGQPLLNESEVEIKELGTDSMAYAYSNRCVASPARLLDSLALFGDIAMLRQAKGALVEELSGSDGKRILKKLRERNRTFKSVMECGGQNWKGITITHFDLSEGISYFSNVEDPSGGLVHIRSFKHGPLRYVQGAIEQNLTTFVRSLVQRGDSAGAVMVLGEIPTPTVEKLEYLQDIGATTVSPEAIAEASECYLRFLQLYHMAEWMAAKGTPEMRFDPVEAKSRIETLKRVLEGRIVEGV